MRIALLKPNDGYYVDWQSGAADYRRLLGDAVSFLPWHDPGDLAGFDLILPLLAWGYHREPGHWYRLLDRWAGLPFANALPILRWNTHKSYLLELEGRGVPIVPTMLSAALDAGDIDAARRQFGSGLLVAKPAISGGAEGTYRLAPGDALPAAVAGMEMLVQPHMPAIATEGEYSLFHFGGQFSHAIVKRPASGDFRVQQQFGGTEVAIDPSQAARALAEQALAALPGPVLYARIDMVRDEAGNFCLMEVELIEPSLFMEAAPDNGRMFAAAVAREADLRATG